MNEYSQGVTSDGAAILKNGERMTIEEVLAELRAADTMRATLFQVDRICLQTSRRVSDAGMNATGKIVAEAMIELFDLMKISRAHVESATHAELTKHICDKRSGYG